MCVARMGDEEKEKSSKTNANTDNQGGWGDYMRAKKRKLADQFGERTELIRPVESNIFQGVAIFVNGYTVPSASDLKRLMGQHGGFYHSYMGSGTTHTVATQLPLSKIAKLKPGDMFVKPEWITDSIKAGRKLPEADYLLYSSKTSVGPSVAPFCLPSTSRDPSSGLRDLSVTSNSPPLTSCDPQFPVASRDTDLSDPQFSVASRDTDLSVPESQTISRDPPVTSDIPELTSRDPLVTLRDTLVDPTSGSADPALTSRDPTTSMPAFPKTCDDNFLDEFFAHSRLHFIATLGQDMKDYVSTVCQRLKGQVLAGPDKLHKWRLKHPADRFRLPAGEKLFMHIDMDCFFVSVGIRDKPELKGKPVVVTHSKGTGKAGSGSEWESRAEIASCSYEARDCGVANGMYLGQALKLCPKLVPIYYDFDGYHSVSRILYDVLLSYTLRVEAVSCDEAYVDLTELCRQTQTSPQLIADCIRTEIQTATRCPVSAGLGPNILVARMATRQAKPSGQHYVLAQGVQKFMGGQKITHLPGVGYVAKQKLQEALPNAEKCADLLSMTSGQLEGIFGAHLGRQMYQFCRGIDYRALAEGRVRKSVSVDVNYGIRLKQVSELDTFLNALAGEVAKRLKNAQLIGQTITLKLLIRAASAPVEPAKFMGCGMCDSASKSITLPSPTNHVAVLQSHLIKLANQIKPVIEDVRGIGVSIHKLQRQSDVTGDEQRKKQLGAFFNARPKTKACVNSAQPIENAPAFKPAGIRPNEKARRPARPIRANYDGRPVMCGRKTTQDVLDMLKYWVANAKPTRFEVAILERYVQEAIRGWYLDHIATVLRGFLWWCSSEGGAGPGGELWKPLAKRLVVFAQKQVQLQYGSTLEIHAIHAS